MRAPLPDEDLTGTVCVDSTGRVGLVTGYKYFGATERWVGLGLDDNDIWCSGRPLVLADSAQEFHERLYSEIRSERSQ